MGIFIEEKKFQIKIVHVISVILVLVFLFGVYGFTMTNFKYHRRIFGNRYTYTVIEKRNMYNDFQSFLKIMLDSQLEINEEYARKINKESLKESTSKIRDTFLEYLPEGVFFNKGELILSNGTLIAADEYTFQSKGDNLQSMVIEVLGIIRDDENFYYLLKGLEPYIQLDGLKDISNPLEFGDYLDEKIKIYSTTDFVADNYQLYQTNMVNDKGKVFFRLLVFSKTLNGVGETMLYYAGGYHEEDREFEYTIRLKGGEEIKIYGDYSTNVKKISGTGSINKEGIYTTDFVF